MGVLLRRWRILFPGVMNCIRLCQKQQQQHCRLYHEKKKHLLLSQHFLSMNLREDKLVSQETKLGEMTCKSQKLMLLGGLIYPSSPGCYHYMPYTVRAMEKLIKVIDQEMQIIGGQKVNMPTLCSAKLWRASGRWELMGTELLRLTDRHGQEYCLGPTHEEAITDLVASRGWLSYKELPLLLYQITRKFRDEPKPRFGLLRGREFYMKDMYTFDASEEAARNTYALVCNAYCNIFNSLGLRFVKVQAATGSIGGTMSHEFQLPADIGEDKLMTCTNCDFSVNVELIPSDQRYCSVCKGELIETKGIEVGHTFFLGTKYSSVFNATLQTSQGKLAPAEMGCYGLGVTRILAAAIEVLSTEDAIHWPSLIAPYQVCFIPPKKGSKEEKATELLEGLYDCVAEAVPRLKEEIVFDDRIHLTIGKRLKDAKKLGYPYVIIGGKKALDEPSLFEVWNQNTGENLFLTREAIIDLLSKVSAC
ncbi:probable proline--tRNA ligase, mitochondrial [Heteronotia binoei]|uniref:probable proline--tRNA ligase, mitochondrial n=1 Tax=Heteronotia binoei TaxID=13085 RepID=UPI002930FCCC|nr:probable proline--tRNA ligase, mitochondrial [Heteronotia binoei]XP_060087857.1 probable proline--tRNA ligase, mitochondrial [Heteronotia binoei]XP_060087858.1 probable proline--tRNA ligase, mitochondrial [Heteronotia binoei]XP_060087859.1 probable proline--tRNA ligase, mitochondrial [Heteronotia binoei]